MRTVLLHSLLDGDGLPGTTFSSVPVCVLLPASALGVVLFPDLFLNVDGLTGTTFSSEPGLILLPTSA